MAHFVGVWLPKLLPKKKKKNDADFVGVCRIFDSQRITFSL